MKIIEAAEIAKLEADAEADIAAAEAAAAAEIAALEAESESAASAEGSSEDPVDKDAIKVDTSKRNVRASVAIRKGLDPTLPYGGDLTEAQKANDNEAAKIIMKAQADKWKSDPAVLAAMAALSSQSPPSEGAASTVTVPAAASTQPTKTRRRASVAIDHKKSVELPPEEKEFMLAVFAQLNKNGDGYLDKEQLVEGLVQMGHPEATADPSVAIVDKMMAAVGLQDQDKISLEDFEIMWKNKPEDGSWSFAGVDKGFLELGSLMSGAMDVAVGGISDPGALVSNAADGASGSASSMMEGIKESSSFLSGAMGGATEAIIGSTVSFDGSQPESKEISKDTETQGPPVTDTSKRNVRASVAVQKGLDPTLPYGGDLTEAQKANDNEAAKIIMKAQAEKWKSDPAVLAAMAALAAPPVPEAPSAGTVAESSGTSNAVESTLPPTAVPSAPKSRRRASVQVDHKKSVAVSSEEKDFMVAVFAQLNKNDDGYLNKDELKNGLREMGHSDPSDVTVTKMLTAVGLENQDKISLEDFEIMWKNKPEDGGTFAGFLESLGSSILF